MYLRQLRYFTTIVELGSFTAAAAELHVSQPALGMQIKQLETELGVTLLKRHSRGVVPTPAGDLLLTHAKDILSQVERTRVALQGFRNRRGGNYRIGMTPSVARALATTLLERCGDQLRDIELHLVQGFSERLAGLMLDGKIDFAFSHRDLTGETWQATPLFLENSYVFGRRELLESFPERIKAPDIVRLPLVLDSRGAHTRDRLNEIAADWNLTANNIVEIESINILREMVAHANRCALSPFALFAEELREGRLDTRRVDEPRLTRVMYLNFRRDSDMAEAEREVRDLIMALVGETVAAGDLRWERLPASLDTV